MQTPGAGVLRRVCLAILLPPGLPPGLPPHASGLLIKVVARSCLSRATHIAISVITKSSAPSSVDTARPLKEFFTGKKGKAFNF